MPTVKKNYVIQKVKKLNEAIDNLKKVLLNTPATGDNWDSLALNPEEYANNFVNIDPDDLTKEIGAIRAMLTEIHKLKNHSEPKLHKN